MYILLPVLMLVIVIGLFANTGRMIYKWFRPLTGRIQPHIFGIVYGGVSLLVILPLILSMIHTEGIPDIVFRIGNHALGFYIYIVLAVNIAAFALFLGRSVRIVPRELSSRTMCIFGTAALLIPFTASLYGSINAASVHTAYYDISLADGESEETEELKLVLVSDIHLGHVIDKTHLGKIVEAVNAQDPDIVCIAGDIFDSNAKAVSEPNEIIRLLNSIEADYGVYACLGNHDAGDTYDLMREILAQTNITLLEDEYTVVDDRFILGGRLDSSPIGTQDQRQPLPELDNPNDLPVIVMDHQPGNIDEYNSETDLILCGHTHKGQFFPVNLITDAIYDVDYGYYHAGGDSPQVVVTSGSGTWGPPQRIGSDNEIASLLIELPV